MRLLAPVASFILGSPTRNLSPVSSISRKGDFAMRRAVLLSALLAFLLGMAGTLRAQTATGQITGTVRDTSGAVMPGVRVTVSSQLTGLSRDTTTSDSG